MSIYSILVKTRCVCVCACVRVYLSKWLQTYPCHIIPSSCFFLSQAAAKGTEMDENGRLTFYIHNDAATSWALHRAHVGHVGQMNANIQGQHIHETNNINIISHESLWRESSWVDCATVSHCVPSTVCSNRALQLVWTVMFSFSADCRTQSKVMNLYNLLKSCQITSHLGMFLTQFSLLWVVFDLNTT